MGPAEGEHTDTGGRCSTGAGAGARERARGACSTAARAAGVAGVAVLCCALLVCVCACVRVVVVRAQDWLVGEGRMPLRRRREPTTHDAACQPCHRLALLLACGIAPQGFFFARRWRRRRRKATGRQAGRRVGCKQASRQAGSQACGELISTPPPLLPITATTSSSFAGKVCRCRGRPAAATRSFLASRCARQIGLGGRIICPVPEASNM